MINLYELSITSVRRRVLLKDSASVTGGYKTGLTSASSGLIVSTIADNEAAPTVYTAAGSTIETITTLGTFAAPTATKCRFKEVDATNHPGLYELQIADARFAVASARGLTITVQCTGCVAVNLEIQLRPAPANAQQINGTTIVPSNLPNLDGSGNVIPASADGLSWASMGELLISLIASPKLTYTDNGDGTATIINYKQDGTTTKFSCTFNKTTGARTASAILH